MEKVLKRKIDIVFPILSFLVHDIDFHVRIDFKRIKRNEIKTKSETQKHALLSCLLYVFLYSENFWLIKYDYIYIFSCVVFVVACFNRKENLIERKRNITKFDCKNDEQKYDMEFCFLWLLLVTDPKKVIQK